VNHGALYLTAIPATRHLLPVFRPVEPTDPITGWRTLIFPCGCRGTIFSSDGSDGIAHVPHAACDRYVCTSCMVASPVIEVDIVSQSGGTRRSMHYLLDFTAPYGSAVYDATTGALIAQNFDSSG